MLINQFFKILDIQTEGKLSVEIEINRDHPVFKGHFPGNPVAPGVCLLQMAKETLEHISGQKLMLKSCQNIKFTAVLNPDIHPNITLIMDHELETEDVHKVNVGIRAGDIGFMTFKGRFTAV